MLLVRTKIFDVEEKGYRCKTDEFQQKCCSRGFELELSVSTHDVCCLQNIFICFLVLSTKKTYEQ